MEFTLPSIVNNITAVFDTSRWEATPQRQPEVTDLGLTGEQVQQLLQLPYGVSELLKDQFPHLTRRNGKLTAVLRTSFAFEHMRRDASLEVIGQATDCNCSSAYQYMIKVRELWETTLGLRITITKDGAHLTQDNEVVLRIRQLVRNMLKHEAQTQKLRAEAQSVERATGQNLLGPATQNLLTAMLDDRLLGEAGMEEGEG